MNIRSCSLVLTLWLAGCATGSPPSSHIQLSAGGVPPGQSPGPRVLLSPVKVPDFLLRNELLTRLDDYQISYSTTVRWAEPIDIGVQRVIAQRLGAGLDSYGVASFPSSPRGAIDWRIDITLRRFETTSDAGLLLADVQIYPSFDSPARSLRVEARQPLSQTNGDEVAATLSILLAELTDRLIDEIRAFEQDRPPQ